MENLKLGKKPASRDKRDLLMARYLEPAALPPIPPRFGHENLVEDWGMLANDNLGDCTIAGAAHEHMLLTAIGSPEDATFTDANVISDYSAVTGYNPSNPATDQGADLHDVFPYRQKTGVIDSKGVRHKVGVYVWLEPGNLQQLLTACYLFGAVGIGVRFPDSAMDQFKAGQVWSVVGGARMIGGHYVPVVACRENLVVVTWGKLQEMTTTFYQTYVDEAVAFLSTELLTEGKSPEGFDFVQLVKDFGLLK